MVLGILRVYIFALVFCDKVWGLVIFFSRNFFAVIFNDFSIAVVFSIYGVFIRVRSSVDVFYIFLIFLVFILFSCLEEEIEV